jgi:CRP-like cAMP-binding protein
MTRLPDVLDGVAAFAGCPAPVGRRLAAHTDVLRPAPGAVLARAGAVAREVVVVVTGVVDVDDGLRLGPGCAFGVDEVLARTPHPATIVAGEGVELRVVNAPAFRAAAHLPGLVPSLARAG